MLTLPYWLCGDANAPLLVITSRQPWEGAVNNRFSLSRKPTDGPTVSRYFICCGATMTDEFRRERAMTVRAIAEKADPFTKKRLLALAAKYALAQRPPTLINSISAEMAQ
jgi:hypothetical protein